MDGLFSKELWKGRIPERPYGPDYFTMLLAAHEDTPEDWGDAEERARQVTVQA